MSLRNVPDSWRPGLAILSGLILTLAHPKFDLFPLAFVALVPLLIGLTGSSNGKAFFLGILCGVTFFATLLHWLVPVMITYGGMPWPVAVALLGLLVLYLACYVALFSVVSVIWCRRFGCRALLLTPLAWVALELVRTHALTGFPWGLLGYSQYRNLPLLQIASLGGVYSVSLLVAAANAGIAYWIAGAAVDGRGARRAGLIFLGTVAIAHLGGFLAIPPIAAVREGGGGEVRVALIQANVRQERKWQPGAEDQIVEDLLAMTRRAAASGARIVVWPESSSPLSFRRPGASRGEEDPLASIEERSSYTARVAALVRELDIELIAGSVDYKYDGGRLRATNSAFRVAPDGTLGPVYDKVHLVPFGEYVPLQKLLFFVNPLVEGAIADFAPGRALQPLPTVAGPAATFICYESIFPRLVRRLAGEAAFLINITNDAWFGRTAGPYQHLAMAILRTVENRRFMARAANTGISALVDPYGRIIERSDLEEAAVLVGAIEPRQDMTVYARTSDLVAWSCAILAVLVLAAPRAAFARLRT
jgi:apolipoprotein N-acyltransferase